MSFKQFVIYLHDLTNIVCTVVIQEHKVMVKTLTVKKLWQIWQITAFHQVFYQFSITFPMQIDFSSPKFFPPNLLQSLFAKAFYCTVYRYIYKPYHLLSNGSLYIANYVAS